MQLRTVAQTAVVVLASSQSALPMADAKSIRGGGAVARRTSDGDNDAAFPADAVPIGDRDDGNDTRDLLVVDSNSNGKSTSYRVFSEGIEPELRGRNLSQKRKKKNMLGKDARIIGGNAASDSEYPWAVSMQDHIGHFCGASLITPCIALTAAHCLGGPYDVVMGTTDVNGSGGHVVPMEREIEHPKYDSRSTNNDFALIVLSDCVDLSKHGLELVEVNPKSNFPTPGQKVTVVGWGDKNPSDFVTDLSKELMEVEVEVISNDECDDSAGTIGGYSDNYHGQITKQMLCAKETNKDACQGDSGGPLVVKKGNGPATQVGVVSWGIGCASKHFPGVYSRVSTAYDWIEEQVCKIGGDTASFDCGGNGNGNGNGGNGNGNGNGNSDGGSSDDEPPPGLSSFGIAGGSGSSGSSDSGGGGGGWKTLFDEDFKDGLGPFADGGNDAKLLAEQKFREGVVRIQNGKGEQSSVYTPSPIDVAGYSTCEVLVEFMMIGLEDNDEWCVETSKGGGGL